MYTIHTSNVTVMVQNMDRAINFYVEGLGLTLKQRWGEHYAQVAAPGLVIGLHPSDKAIETQNSVSLGFGVEKIEEAEARLKALGIAFNHAEGKGGKFASFIDPDGTPLYFMETQKGDW
jgi:predicted enzyme related to lactoylglutathione lyase